MTLLIALAILALAVALYFAAHPVRPGPRYKFNSIIPRLLDTGAVTCLGWCFVRRHFIAPHHRAHEHGHHEKVKEKGRWRHLYEYLRDFVGGLLRWGLERVETPTGKLVLRAYYDHPEERWCREYADAHAATTNGLGAP
jgi:type VI protein secretion system component VasK